MEHYLLFIRDFNFSKCLSKIRLSSHSLEIEAGRHRKNKISVELRICKFCSGGEVEDEFHFIMSCPFYIEERITFLTKIVSDNEELLNGSIENVFKNIMSTKNENVIFSLCIYIQKCFRKRNERT